jgi:hypothetical protein
MIFYSGIGLDAANLLACGVRILAFGGMVYASFSFKAYRFSDTPLYYVIITVLMVQMGWSGYLKTQAVMNDMAVVAVNPSAHAVVPAKPAVTAPAVVAAPVPTPPPVDNSPYPKDVASGPVVITSDMTKYVNPDHVHTVMQPTPVPDMATTKETPDSETAAH